MNWSVSDDLPGWYVVVTSDNLVHNYVYEKIGESYSFRYSEIYPSGLEVLVQVSRTPEYYYSWNIEVLDGDDRGEIIGSGRRLSRDKAFQDATEAFHRFEQEQVEAV